VYKGNIPDEHVKIDLKRIQIIFLFMVANSRQVVWAETREVGCGVFGNNKPCIWGGWNDFNCAKYVCNYGPGGNVLNEDLTPQPPYSTTTGCVKPSKKYPGLCAA
jgi:hypothetical protein